MIDKQEMERVWADEQPGWLKQYNKNAKGKKKFKVTLKPYLKQYLDPVSKVVYAKNRKDAEYQRPYDEMRAKYPEHFEKSQIGNHYWMKPGVTVEVQVEEVKDVR